MKKLRLFLLAFVMLLCGTVVFGACDKEEEEKPENPIVAVESTVNPILTRGSSFVVDSNLYEVIITTSIGDTPGEIKWENASQKILLGENKYTWVFTPEDTQRYNPASGELTITGIDEYNLTIQMDNWVYGEIGNEPRVIGYTGPSEDITITYEYYTAAGVPLTGKPTEAGEYKLCAVISIVGLDEIRSWFDPFYVLKAEIEDFGLAVENWVYDSTPNLPTVKDSIKDMVDFVYSTEENGTYTAIMPLEAGTYYVKAVINDNNYFGTSLPKSFVIEKADYKAVLSVQLDGWTYGEEANTVEITSVNDAIVNVDDLDGLIDITYAVKGTDNFVETVPTDAGDYVVKVVVGELPDGNYKTTEFIVEFTIGQSPLA